MRLMSLVVAAALALLASCGVRDEGTTEAPADPGAAPDTRVTTPSLHQVSYYAEGSRSLIFDGELVPYPVQLHHQGRLWRALISDGHGAELFDYDGNTVTDAAGQVRQIEDIHDLIYYFTGGRAQDALEDGEYLLGNVVGPCTHLGEAGTLYSDGDDQFCVTPDGIPLLHSDDQGRVYWELTKLERGPQNPALFPTPTP